MMENIQHYLNDEEYENFLINKLVKPGEVPDRDFYKVKEKYVKSCL